MADQLLEKLRMAFVVAPAGAVTLNDGFWTNAGLTPPPNFSVLIKAAYRLPEAAPGLSISYARDAVTPIVDDAFRIEGVAMDFLNADPSQVTATIHGRKGDDGPILGVDVVPKGWALASQFPYMTGLPFVLLAFDQERFFFSSAPQKFIWREEGAELSFEAGQNLYGLLDGALGVTASVAALLAMIENGPPAPTSPVMFGRIVLDKADNEKILFPEMDLRGPIASGAGLKLFMLDIAAPYVGFKIETAVDTHDEDGAPILDELGAPTSEAVQTPFLYFGVGIDVKGADGEDIDLAFQVALDTDAKSYAFSIGPGDETKPITPSAIIALMAGKSFYEDVPASFQEFLASVQMQGFTLAGPLRPSPGLDRLSALIGSVQGKPIVFFTDPTSGQEFKIDSYSLAWTLLQPTDAPTNLLRIEAAFELFPHIFRKLDGTPGGLFEISIDETLEITGDFAGKASFGDLLGAITDGAVGLPKGVEIDFSNIYVTANPTQKAYSLAFEVDANFDVPFVEYTDSEGAKQPLLQLLDMQFKLGANTPTSGGNKGATVFTGSVEGEIIVGPVMAHALVDYDGSLDAPLWSFAASLSQPLDLSQLASQFLRAYNLPDFLPGDLSVRAFAVDAKIPTEKKAKTTAAQRLLTIRPARHVAGRHSRAGWRSPVRPYGVLLATTARTQPSYLVTAKIYWKFDIGALSVDTSADLGLNYDGDRAEPDKFAGWAIATIDIDSIGVSVDIGYRFGPAASDRPQLRLPTQEMLALTVVGDSNVLWMAWKGFRAEYSFAQETVSFSLSGWTLGSLVTALVEMIGDPYFVLPDPWSLLNKIPLDGLSIQFDLKSDVQYRVTAKYSLPSPIDFGFFSLKGLDLKRVEGKVTLALDGQISVPGLQQQPLFNKDGPGQDVKKMPDVPGQGGAFFKLQLLALGQRVGIYKSGEFNSTQAVIAALQKIPPSSSESLPFDPKQQTPGMPYYDSAKGWLVAMHFGILQIDKKSFAIDFMIVFNDPDIYGLRLALSGDKMKVLAGLAIDILYKKITDDVGCYQIEFTLPSFLRNLDFGAVSVTLPSIGLQVYTNGDFLVDFGFPYNMDFSNSFTAQAIILGVPVLGSGGFYFGKLSSATARNMPVTTKGLFNPVIVLGLGAQIGLGRTIDKGILKAGFSITFFGIIEGVLAAWRAYSGTASSDASVQSDYYFKISGTFGIIGKLFGSIDFAIIKADVSLTVQVYVRIVYEFYRQIPLTLSASVQISVTIKIDFWLFSIDISLSFAASITEQLTIGQNALAPWDDATRPLTMRTLHELGVAGVPLRLDFRRRASATGVEKQRLEISALTQFTVLGRESAAYKDQEGAFVLLFAVSAPTASASTPRSEDNGEQTAFGKLAGALLPWIISSVRPEPGLLPPTQAEAVSRPLLEGVLRALADPSKPPFTAGQLIDFFEENFVVVVSPPPKDAGEASKSSLKDGAAIFPAFAFLSFKAPNPGGDGDVAVDFASYVKSTEKYQAKLREIFNSVAANVDSETKKSKGPQLSQDDEEPLAASVFVDYFILLARQLTQSAIDSFDDYPYPLTSNSSMQSILDWANAIDLLPGQLSAEALAMANLDYPLEAGKQLGLADVSYMVQVDDTLASIAARYANPSNKFGEAQTTAEALILANAGRNNLLYSGVQIDIVVAGVKRSYTTAVGDDFNTVAASLDVTIEQLAQQSVLYDRAGLLASSVVATVPNVTITTGPKDSIRSVLEWGQAPLASFLTPENLRCEGLWRPDATLRFAAPGLTVLPISALWPAIATTGALGHIAGTASRYMLHGMRLPVETGLDIPGKGFLYGAPHWPEPQTAYGVYQLTGQQFPLAERADGPYEITLSRPSDTKYSWITLGDGDSLRFDVAAQAEALKKLLPSVQTAGYKPKIPVFKPQPETTLAPRLYGVASQLLWLTSDMANLLAVTKPPGADDGRLTAAHAPQPKPLLFELSGSLLRAVERLQAKLAAHDFAPTVRELSRFLPVIEPKVAATDPATMTTQCAAIQNFAFAARVDFRVKRLAQDADLAPQRPEANSIVPPGPGNSGSPARALAPYAYEIIGPNPADAVLLERLLTAMASEGEDLVSDIFLLYADLGNGAKGLTSRAKNEFLAFIQQSNLSTETNPPPALTAMLTREDGGPCGVANSKAEFIKLLWELSTVNSGGSYLFYQLLAEGGGLPVSLFDDSGVATVTLVATVTRDSAFPGDAVFNAINALVVADAIDPEHAILQLEGKSAPAISWPLDPKARFGAIADSYGLDLGGLARTNADAQLSLGLEIPIAGLYRQLLPYDIGEGKDPLQALADYYSRGAVTPISKQDIIEFNPGVEPKALAVFRIPRFIYRTRADGPGASFTAMSRYYDVGVSTLARQVEHVQNLFVGPTITIDPLSLDAQSNQGLGNVGLALERERGAPPDSKTQPIGTYAELTMLQNYQLLSAGIEANAFFDASPDSAAFGPKDAPATKPSCATRAAKARPMAARVPAPTQDKNFVYDQTLGFSLWSKVNAAAAAIEGDPLLPTPAENPYVGVGSILQFRLAWQDLFGNRAPTPFDRPAANDPAPFGGLPCPIFYSDRLTPLDQWPSTTRAFRFVGEAGEPLLQIWLKFDKTPYEPSVKRRAAYLEEVRPLATMPIWQSNATIDLAKFKLIYFQLTQDYTPLKIPGLNGPAVTMWLRNSLLEQPESALTSAARELILDFVRASIVYLEARAAGKSAEPPAETRIEWRIELDALVASTDIVQLEIELRFSRQPELVAPELRALADGLSAKSLIPPDGGVAPGDARDSLEDVFPVSLTEFAAQFEKAFVTPNWRLRVGSSAAEPSQPRDARAATLWAVRMSDLTGASPKGIGFEFGGAPRYYAPLPIAGDLKTLSVDINSYKTGLYPDGAPVKIAFTNIDPNTWLAECLGAVDDFLSASYATPAFVLDRLLKLKEKPDADSVKPDPKLGFLARMLLHKRTLAEAIASTAASVLDQPQEIPLQAAAVDKLEQALLRRLSDAAALSCVAVFPVSKAIYAPPLPTGVAPPRLFGQPLGVTPQEAKKTGDALNANFTLSTAKIPLVSPDIPLVSPDDLSAKGASSLAFLFTSRMADQQAYVPLDLTYALSHIEHNIHGVPGIEKYEQSSWIAFVSGPSYTPIHSTEETSFAIPVPLRALPTPPTVVAQSGARASQDTPKTPADLKSWAYSFNYLLRLSAQDTVVAEVEFNGSGDANLLRAGSKADALYAALAQFVAIYPAVWRDLETYLRPINGKSELKSVEVTNAKFAVEVLDTVVQAVASTYDAWAKSLKLDAGAQDAPPRIAYTFEIAMEPGDDDQAVVDILPRAFEMNGAPANYFLPLAKVFIDPDNYAPKLIASDPTTGTARYQYQLRDDAKDKTLPQQLPYATALSNAERRVEFSPLDLFSLQSGWASVQVVRNRHLAPPTSKIKTNPVFEFATTKARFADPVTPLLDYVSYPLDFGAANPQRIADWLREFFKDLLTPPSGIDFHEPVLVKLDTAYSYLLAPSVAATPATQIPISLLPPTTTLGATDPAFVSAVAKIAQDWFDEENPLNDVTSSFQFDLAAWSATNGGDMPLLRVGALTLKSQNVTPSTRPSGPRDPR